MCVFLYEFLPPNLLLHFPSHFPGISSILHDILSFGHHLLWFIIISGFTLINIWVLCFIHVLHVLDLWIYFWFKLIEIRLRTIWINLWALLIVLESAKDWFNWLSHHIPTVSLFNDTSFNLSSQSAKAFNTPLLVIKVWYHLLSLLQSRIN